MNSRRHHHVQHHGPTGRGEHVRVRLINRMA